MSLKDIIIESQAAKKMMESILSVYDNDEYMLYVFETIGKEIDELIKWVSDFENQPYPQFATFTLPFWEDSLGLEIDEKASVEVRRNRIITKLSTYFPITKFRLEQIASAVAGVPIIIEDFSGPYTFNVVLDGYGTVNFVELIQEVNEVKPAHLSFTVTQKLKESIYYSTVLLTGEEITVYPWQTSSIETKAKYVLGSAMQTIETLTVYPE